MQTIDCHTAGELIQAYFENRDPDRDDVEAVIDHIKHCPQCQDRLGHLFRALTTDQEDRLNCEECEELLPGYVQAETEGRADETRWRQVTFHIETCPHCSAAYSELAELVVLAHGERGEEPPYYPVPDLSFLRSKKAETAVLWHLDELGRLIIEFSAELLRSLQPPAHQLAYATAGLKSDESQRTRYQLDLKEAVDDLEVAIKVEEMPDDPALCTV